MVTRAQAAMKRKAGEEELRSTPAKSSRSNGTREEDPQRRKDSSRNAPSEGADQQTGSIPNLTAGTAPKASNSQMRQGKEGGHTAPVTEKIAPHPDPESSERVTTTNPMTQKPGGPSHRQSDAQVGENKADSVPKRPENQSEVQPGHHKSAKVNTTSQVAGVSGDNKETDSAQEKTERHISTVLVRQLQLTIERQRVVEMGDLQAIELEKHQKSIAKCCEISVKPEIRHSVFLKMFPTAWWEQMHALREQTVQLGQSKEHLEHSIQEAVRHTVARDTELTAIGLAWLYDEPDEKKKELDDGATVTLEALHQARTQCTLAQRAVDENVETVRVAAAPILRMTEKILVDHNMLRPDVSTKGLQHGVEVEEPPSSPGQDNYGKRRPRPRNASYSQVVYDYGRPGKPEPAEDRYYDPSEGSFSYNNVPRRERRQLDPLAELRREVMQRFYDASNDRYKAEANFNAVRDNYGRELADFLEAADDGQAVGTKTDFDLAYFVRRNEANRDLARCCEEEEFELKEADRTGAMSVRQRMKYLGEEYNPQGPIDGFIADHRWWETLERVEEWRRDKSQQDIESERHWQEMLVEPVYEGKPLNGSDDLDRHYVAIGEHRSRIDDWQAQQEKTRAHAESLRQRSGAAEELPWWQVCDGIA